MLDHATNADLSDAFRAWMEAAGWRWPAHEEAEAVVRRLAWQGGQEGGAGQACFARMRRRACEQGGSREPPPASTPAGTTEHLGRARGLRHHALLPPGSAPCCHCCCCYGRAHPRQHCRAIACTSEPHCRHIHSARPCSWASLWSSTRRTSSAHSTGTGAMRRTSAPTASGCCHRCHCTGRQLVSPSGGCLCNKRLSGPQLLPSSRSDYLLGTQQQTLRLLDATRPPSQQVAPAAPGASGGRGGAARPAAGKRRGGGSVGGQQASPPSPQQRHQPAGERTLASQLLELEVERQMCQGLFKVGDEARGTAGCPDEVAETVSCPLLPRPCSAAFHLTYF